MDNLVTYKRDFKKKDRKLIATFRYGIDDINSDGGLLATNQYYKNGTLDSTEIIDQLKSTVGHSETYGGKITYSEPLSVKWSLITEYSYYKNNATADKNTFEKDNNGKYTVLNPVYSNNFDFDASSNTGNAIFKYTSRKLNMSAGSGISSIKLNLLNKDNQQQNTFNFLNVTPQVQARYNLKAQTAIRFGYRGSTRQPSINQLQPLQDNSDPLNVYIGNPDLKVGFSHNLNLGYNSFKTLSQRYIFASGSINFLSNAITTTSTIDQFGKRVYKPVNVNGNYNWNIYGDMYKESAENKFNKSFGVQMNGGRNINFINGEQNENNYATLSVNFGIGKYKKDKYNFQVRPQVARNLSKSSLRKDVNNNYWSYGGDIWGEVTLPWNIEISTNLEADLRQKLEVFNQSNNITVWNMTVTRSFLKKKNLKLIFSAHDILNQNKGFERTINSSFISDNSYLKLGRYFMLGLQWSFTNTPLDK